MGQYLPVSGIELLNNLFYKHIWLEGGRIWHWITTLRPGFESRHYLVLLDVIEIFWWHYVEESGSHA